MSRGPTTSVDVALQQAIQAVGPKQAARLLRAAAFADSIDDSRPLRPQLAKALLHAVATHGNG
jgi:hypothetical protein